MMDLKQNIILACLVAYGLQFLFGIIFSHTRQRYSGFILRHIHMIAVMSLGLFISSIGQKPFGVNLEYKPLSETLPNGEENMILDLPHNPIVRIALAGSVCSQLMPSLTSYPSILVGKHGRYIEYGINQILFNIVALCNLPFLNNIDRFYPDQVIQKLAEQKKYRSALQFSLASYMPYSTFLTAQTIAILHRLVKSLELEQLCSEKPFNLSEFEIPLSLIQAIIPMIPADRLWGGFDVKKNIEFDCKIRNIDQNCPDEQHKASFLTKKLSVMYKPERQTHAFAIKGKNLKEIPVEVDLYKSSIKGFGTFLLTSKILECVPYLLGYE